jgi:hypothetical protein
LLSEAVAVPFKQGQSYDFDWDNQPLIQMTNTTDETAPQHEAPPTLAFPCPNIVNDTSEVDNNTDRAKALAVLLVLYYSL